MDFWSYCVKSKPDIASFVFELFDHDESTFLSEAEMKTFVVAVHGSLCSAQQTKLLIDRIDRNKDKVITRKEFLAGVLCWAC